eukprot:607923-Pyramimonas_sp.AAC.2
MQENSKETIASVLNVDFSTLNRSTAARTRFEIYIEGEQQNLAVEQLTYAQESAQRRQRYANVYTCLYWAGVRTSLTRRLGSLQSDSDEESEEEEVFQKKGVAGLIETGELSLTRAYLNEDTER